MKPFIPTLLLTMLSSLIVMTADAATFDPSNPPEPGAVSKLTLLSHPSQTGLLHGDGSYSIGQEIWVDATPVVPGIFIGWKVNDSIVSQNQGFSFLMPDRPITLTAFFDTTDVYTASLLSTPTNDFYLEGQGYYKAGSTIQLNASMRENFRFDGWWTADTLLSSSSQFVLIMPKKDIRFTAKYTYNPGNPNDPTTTVPTHPVTLTSNPQKACTFNYESGGYIREGESFQITAYPKSGFVFDGWYLADSLLTTNATLVRTMGQTALNLTAKLHFDPISPQQPEEVENPLFSLIGLNQTGTGGNQLSFPIYLSNLNQRVFEAGFQLSFPPSLMVDPANIALSGRSNGHQLTVDTLGNNVFRVTVTSPEKLSFSGTSGILLTIPVTIPTAWEPGSYQSVPFSDAYVRDSLNTITCPVKDGSIGVATANLGLYASFFQDIHLNRVQFTSTSSVKARTYLWRFGDGQTSTLQHPLHVYDKPGNYEVTLAVSDGIDTDTTTTGISIDKESLWRLDTYYTLNPQRSGVKNFTSARELFDSFSRCSITGSIIIQVQPGIQMDIPMDQGLNDDLMRLDSLLTRSRNSILTFQSDTADTTPWLHFNGTLQATYAQTILHTARNMRFNHVVTAINYKTVDIDALHSLSDVTVCSGHPTSVIDLSVISSQMDVDWTLAGTPLHLSGYEQAGSYVLPSMTLLNAVTATDSLTYHLRLLYDGLLLYERPFRYVVYGTLKQTPAHLAPASNQILGTPSVTLRWTYQENAFYDVFLWERGTTMPQTPVVSGLWTGTYTDTRNCQYGKSYHWRILARSACDSLWSVVDSFQVGRMPDLVVEEIRVNPQETYAGEPIQVTATIRNIGGKSLKRSWSDELFLVKGNNKTSLARIDAVREMLPDSGYQVVFNAILPLDSIAYTHVSVTTDSYNQLQESIETNNSTSGDALNLKHRILDPQEKALLRELYDQTGGNNWTRRWHFSTDTLIASNWPGITFRKGRIIGIDLNNNHLTGMLPAACYGLPYLETLYLQNNTLQGRLDRIADTLRIRNLRSDSLRRINLANNQLEGELSDWCSLLPSMTWLNLDGNKVTEIDTLLSRTISSLSLQNQTFQVPDFELSVHPSLILPSLMQYGHENRQLKRPDASFHLYRKGNYLGSIYQSNQQFNFNPNNDWVYVSGDTFEIRQANYILYNSHAPVRITFNPGDANLDQHTDVLDVQHTLNRIFSNYAYPFNRVAANTKNDAVINIQDIVSTVNILLATGVVVDTIGDANLRSATADNYLYVSNGRLMLNALESVCVMDVSLSGVSSSQMAFLLNSNEFQLTTKNTPEGVRFILYSTNGHAIPCGETALMELNSQHPVLTYAKLGNAQAENMPVTLMNQPTGLSNTSSRMLLIETDREGIRVLLGESAHQLSVQVYSLQGIVVQQWKLQNVAAGRHSLERSGLLPTGAYLIKVNLTHGANTQTKLVKWIVSK